MQQNKETAYKTVESTRHAGESLKEALNAVALITRLNKDAAEMADGQKSVTNNVTSGLASIQGVGADNSEYAQEVASSCEELVSQIKQMQMQLRKFHF